MRNRFGGPPRRLILDSTDDRIAEGVVLIGGSSSILGSGGRQSVNRMSTSQRDLPFFQTISLLSYIR